MSKVAVFLIHILSYLPLTVLYLLSDFVIYPVVRFVIRYRRNVVEKNLALAFPQKEERERLRIERKFYHFLSDVFVETMKMERMSKEELRTRFIWDNIDEVVNSPTEERPFTLCFFAHYANWEWSICNFVSDMPEMTTYIYSPLHNKAFEKWLRKSRSKFGDIPIEMYSVSALLESLYENKQKRIIYAASDQLPKEQYVKHFHRFMGIKTKVLTGTEGLINKYNMIVYYCVIKRIKRGYYICTAERIDDPIERKDGEWPITDAYYDRLQQQIHEQPEFWLWSHDRWRR